MKTLTPCPSDALQTERRRELWTNSSLFARPDANGAEDFHPPHAHAALMQTDGLPLTAIAPVPPCAEHPTGG
ncbi:hypothetical protein [Acetobacter persici]|uniref:hypothetical protein n=1 Tax=Acetobacter persici TaxID=1076596 RepID=UPI0011778910|nr:hypothetical protein [Acetobacter persici]